MSDKMTFPDTWEEFEKSYGFIDSEEIYTNGSRLIPSFRVKQWLDHIAQSEIKQQATVSSDCISRQEAVNSLLTGKEFLMRVLDDADVVGQDREKYSWGLGLIESCINDIEELPSAEKVQLSGEDATFDCISRQATIDVEGLDEQIRCEMCRNPMHTSRGCDGNCKYDEKLYERIMQILGERIKPLPSASTELSNNSPKLDNENGELISRQAAIRLAEQGQIQGFEWQFKKLCTLPSAEPEIIHCKNCKHRDSNDCPMYYEEWIEIDEGDGYFDTDDIIHDRTTDEGFCHCAELRGEQDEIN